MINFEYTCPGNLHEVLNILKKPGSHIIAGGTDLLVHIKETLVLPQHLLDINGVPELQEIKRDESGIKIGAAVTLADIISSKVIQDSAPVLIEGASTVGSKQIRQRATLAGNICNASPAADTMPSLLVLGAKVKVVSDEIEKIIPLEKFITGPGQTSLKPGEMVKEIILPSMEDCGKGVYFKVSRRRALDLAIVGIAVWYGQGEVRIALGAVARTPIRVSEAEKVLKVNPFNLENIERASLEAVKMASPLSDLRASAAYRKELIKTLVERGIRKVCFDE